MSFEYVNKRGTKYYLNSRAFKLKSSGFDTVIYYFSKDERESGCDLPAGKEVMENEKTGLPVLRNSETRDILDTL